MNHSIQPVILSGGSGTRLWPLSRRGYPKQFLTLLSDRSLFQETLKRLDGLEGHLPAMAVCNDEHRFILAEQARKIDVLMGSILIEPEAKNTAPAIALAAIKALESGKDPLLLVLPSDHVFEDVGAFHKAVIQAAHVANEGDLVVFGICPTRPEIGYGYIRKGLRRGEDAYRVEQFIEKPNEATAKSYLDIGGYYWNSGMFLFRASRYLEELEIQYPEMVDACKHAIAAAKTDLDFCRIDAKYFSRCISESIDYAVMETAKCVAVIPLDAGWNDVGTWPAVHDFSEKDSNGNVVIGDVVLEDSSDSYVYAQSRLVCGLGLDKLIVIETPDAVMILPRARSHEIKKMVDSLKKKGRPETEMHRQVYRPWGSYDSIDEGLRFKVKRIVVKPGEKLSLQMHHHRAEHWIVVSGTALITVDGAQTIISENQSTYIPLGFKHRLENPGKIDLQLIEVQSGTYLGEDDIFRFTDDYGRV